MQVKRLSLLVLLPATLCLTSCVQNATKSYTAIDGNWHIAGAQDLMPRPLLTLAIGANGNAIYAYGDVGVNCANNGGGVGGSLSLTGQVASDGSFLMSNSAFPLNTIQVSVKGKVPAEGSTTWTGSYTITNAANQTQCSFNDSSSFVATAYPPLDGTYTGTIAGSNSAPNLTISTQISQGAATFTQTSSPSMQQGFRIPLSGSIAVTGSPCFTSGTTTTGATGAPSLPVEGSIGGETFSLNYIMNDGSQLQLQGYLADSSETTLEVQIAMVFGGKCSGIIPGSGDTTYTAVLTRQ
jgi:hypothetical protein